jgi:DNA-binding transcriptional LysR family regulator
MFSRFTRYFDEVARCGSIRRASERLHIAPSAVDRQILNMEEELGVPLFERLPHGLRLTAAGEVLVDAVRRWQRDLKNVRAQIDDLQGLKRGEVSIALAESSTDFLALSLKSFKALYPGISFGMRVLASSSIVDMVISGEADIGLTFSAPNSHALRVERTLLYQIGAAVSAGHPLADRAEIALLDCAHYPLVIPTDAFQLRTIFNQAWARTVGGKEEFSISVNNIGLMKQLIEDDHSIAMLTRIDVVKEMKAGTIRFIPLTGFKIPLSIFSLITATGRTLPAPAKLLVEHLGRAMEQQDAPMIHG